MTPPLLILRNITLSLGDTNLLSGTELIVSKRDRICLVGRNGSGKSTLLKIAAGQVEADDGERDELDQHKRDHAAVNMPSCDLWRCDTAQIEQ